MSYETDIETIALLSFSQMEDGVLRSDTGVTRATMRDTVFMVEIDGSEIRFIPYAGTRRSIETYRLVRV